MATLEALAAASQSQASASTATGSSRKLADDFDSFLQLLTTQLRNQDPLEPMDANEFTNQLVQFSSVEQQIQTNSYMETLISSTQAQSVNAAVNYLGSTVRAAGVTTTLSDGSASWDLVTSSGAPDSTITIFDENGQEVYSTSHSVERGESTFTWDGKTTTGASAPDGIYSIRVVGNSADGQSVPVYTAVEGEVTGVDFTGSEPILQLGDVRVTLASVMQIRSQDS